MQRSRNRLTSIVATMGVLTGMGYGQVIHHHYHETYFTSARPLAANIIVPQARAYVFTPGVASAAVHATAAPRIEITAVDVGVVIVEQVATTTMDISLKNLTASRQEAEMVVPVPNGAVIRAFTFQGAAAEPKAELLPRDEAKAAYNAIVAKIRDPALLEFVGYNMVRSAVFPLDPNGTQKVRLTYEHLLAADGNRVDYELPRTESLAYNIPWNISVRVKSKRPVSTVYSPSHKVETRTISEGICAVKVSAEATQEPGSFRLSYLTGNGAVTASLLAYPDPKTGGGYFLLLAGAPHPAAARDGSPAIRREVTLVLDRSGSMRGEKLDQVREAAIQVIEGLDDGEAFNIILYDTQVEVFSPQAVRKDRKTAAQARAYLAEIKPRGGTNIHDALVEALRARPLEGMLPIVLFLTDGLPTIGQTSEAEIREVAGKANTHNRRIFTFGVGLDVNTPLLDKIAAQSRATATFVLPKEDVEVKVAQVFKRLSGPILSDPALAVVDADGNPCPGRVREMTPAKLADVFADDQIVLLGKYSGDQPIRFRLSGNYLGQKRTFDLSFALDGATTRNAFVPRLWASRQIALLLDGIRELGADAPAGVPPAARPKLKELVDEVVRLSTEFGVLTEYTAFLAREGTDLTRRDEVLAEAMRNFQNRAMQTRSGLASVNQEYNIISQRSQVQLNGRNGFYDQNMNRVQVATVQQVSDRAFYRRGNQWVDSRVANAAAAPDRVVRFGSEEFHDLANRLAAENRGGTIALGGDILMEVDGRRVLVLSQTN